MTNDDGKIFLPTKLPPPHFVMVGNGHAIPISSSGHSTLRSSSGLGLLALLKVCRHLRLSLKR
jgi:hypothetical protein